MSTEHKGLNPHTTAPAHVALIAQLVEHCTGNAKVVGSNPVQSLKIFQVFFSSSVMAAFILSIIIITKGVKDRALMF